MFILGEIEPLYCYIIVPLVPTFSSLLSLPLRSKLTSNRGHNIYLNNLFVFIMFYLYGMKQSMHSILFSQISTTNAMRKACLLFSLYLLLSVSYTTHVIIGPFDVNVLHSCFTVPFKVNHLSLFYQS